MAYQASLSRKGVLQARILEHIGQYWLPYPAVLAANPLSTWCCQNPCDPSSCTTSALALTGANPSPPGQPQEQPPVEDPHAEGHVGSVTKEEDPKPSHQLYKLQIKST